MTAKRTPARTAAFWVLGLYGVTAVTAIAVAAVPPAAGATERALQLSFEPRPATLGEAADILVANLRVIGGVLLLTAAVRRKLSPQWAGVLVAAALAVGNAVIVGGAVGAYGLPTAAPWLVHVPLEWTALGVAASTVSQSTPSMALAFAAALATACLIGAALLETYATPVAA